LNATPESWYYYSTNIWPEHLQSLRAKNSKASMFSPYELHQQCSNKFCVGNALLAGDAARVCNPFGGMGLTTGLCDAGALVDCLVGMLKKGCGDDLLDKYASI
jgi:2-polyprenyl-6-methoxyphenol hydroxylase-like FAD-dependent oxidoreductase